jgi:hypothetical protein
MDKFALPKPYHDPNGIKVKGTSLEPYNAMAAENAMN